jgi:hypothetical protein
VERLDRSHLYQRLRALILVTAGLDDAGLNIAKPAQLIRGLRYQLVTVSDK